jgi:hypothetical protein
VPQTAPPGVAGTDVVEAVLGSVAGYGDFFRLPIVPLPLAPEPDDPAGRRPFTDLIAAGASSPLRQILDALARYLGTPVSRPVASLLHLGAAARLCAPLLAAAADFGVVPDLDERHLRYACEPSGRLVLSAAEAPAGRTGDLPALADAIHGAVIGGPLATLTGAINQIVPLSGHTTRGNVASALAAAARILGAEDPERAGGARAHELLALLLDREPLRRAGSLRPSGQSGMAGQPGTTYFRRRNCCLFFQIPGGGTCGDCILAD